MTKRGRTIFGGLAALLMVLVIHPANAQDAATSPVPDDASPKGKWLPVLVAHAGEYEIVESPGGAKAVMRPDPLMRWSQPVRGGEDGVICLWTVAGKPAAVMSFFTLKAEDGKRWIVHEHQSLSASPLEASWQGRAMWRISGPGLAFEAVPDAPEPAGSSVARARQMQAILRDFSANTVDHGGRSWTLRALNKPLYRYEGTGPDGPDGALFAMAQGTDPEAFVILETRSESGRPRWVYAVTRLTDLALKVRLKGREILSVAATVGAADEPYQTFIVINKASDDPADFVQP